MATKYHDYYKTLGIERTAGTDEIQRAYRALARKYHPDVNKEPGAEARFKELGEAYEVLKDPKKRERYDALGADWKPGQEFRPPPGWGGWSEGGEGGFGGTRGRSASTEEMGDFSDFFESLFGGRGGVSMDFGGPFGHGGMGGGTRAGPRPPRPRSGADHEAEITVSLVDAIKGGTRQIALSADGNGDSRTYDVRIPPGVTDGTVIRLGGQGGEGRHGGSPGDLLLRVRIAPDPRFRIDPPGGHDLVAATPVTPSEAALGAKIDVPTPDGSVRVTVPAGSQSGQKLRIRGHGLAKRTGERGDLLAELRIVVPRTLTPPEREAYERLAAASEWNPRTG